MLMGWLRSLDGAHYIAKWRGVPIDLRFNSFLGWINGGIHPARAKQSYGLGVQRLRPRIMPLFSSRHSRDI